VNESSDLSDQSNIEFTDTEEKEPKTSDTHIGGAATYTDTYFTSNVWVDTSASVTFINCTWAPGIDLYLEDPACDVTIDLSNLNKIYVRDDGSQLSVTNSTLTKLTEWNVAPGYYEFINVTFTEGESTNLYIYYSSVDLKNCTVYNTATFLYDNVVVIEDCTFYGALNFPQYSGTVDVEIRNSRIYYIDIPNGDITIQDTECKNFDVEFNCSIDETLELKSHTPNVVLSNVKLGDPLPGEFSQLVITDANLNISDITKEINSKLYILQWQDSELYVKNSYLAYFINSDAIGGPPKVSNFKNCTFINTWVRSNITFFSNCTFYNILDVDTNSYPYGGSNKPFKIENSNFLDVTIHVLSGGVDIDNCDFKTDMGLLWLDTYVYSYDNKKDTFALINNSNPKIINLGWNTSIIAENLDCNSISMRDTSQGIFNNVDVGTMNVLDSATATIDNCHINSATFDSPNVQITNSIVDSMAPTLATVPSPLTDPNDFLLDWLAQPGQNLTGNIVSYQIFRADTNIGGEDPSPTDYQLINTIPNPDPTDPADTTFYDTALNLPSVLDESQLYYKVEITDQGGNSGNSTITSTIFDTTLLPGLDITTGIHFYADEIFDRSVYVRGDAVVTFENCTWPSYHSLYVQETGNVTIDNCTFNGIAYFNNPNINVDVNNSRFEGLILTDCNLKIENSKFNDIELYNFDCSINETLELWSHSAGVQFSNFKAFESGGGNARINVRKGARLNVTDINKDALKLDLVALPSDVADWGDCELHVKNSDLFYVLIWHSEASDGKSIASFQNCSIYGTYGPDSEIGIRSNYTVFSNCTFYDLIQVDTNWQGLGSNKAFIIENSTFFNYIDVVTGGVEIDKCDFEGVMGFIWIKGQDTFALVNNSDPTNIRQDANTVLTAENLVCETIWMQDTSHGIFNNVDVGTMNVFDLADATIDNCHINNRNFQSPNVQITNSIVEDMAPTLAAMPSPFDDLKDFLLNWSTQPGQNLTGNIVSYRIFRAYTVIGAAYPSPTDYQQIGLISNPDPTDPADTHYDDTLLVNFDGYELYYIVEITDVGGNSGNSTILSSVYDTGLVFFDDLDATVLFDDSLTTYDDILVSVFMIDADINNNGTQDCGNVSLHCQFKYGSTILDQTIEPTGESIEGIVYYFLIPQTLAATEITFSIQIEQNSYFDGIGLFDFNSTAKYGKKFTIKKPTIAFNPVDHPSEDKILVSKRIELSVSAVSGAQYISSIKVYYRVDGGDWESKSMTYDSEESEYNVKLPKFDPCTLEYYVIYIDIAGNEDELLGSKDDPETIEIIPDFPQTRLEAFDLGMIFIGSALVGIVFGFAYVFLDLNLKKRTTLKRTQKLKTIVDKSDKSKKAPAKKTHDMSTI